MAATSKVREDLSQQFLAALKQGHIPWQACWSQERPLNAVTGKNYRGINAFVLSWFGDDRGYTDPRWCTYRQAQDKGWQVRKGEKGVKVEYWAYYDAKEKKLLSWDDVRQKLKAGPDYEKNLQLRCRNYTVFNGEQIDGIPALERRHTNIGTLRQKRDTLIRNMNVGYREFGTEAYYSPSSDIVTLPPEATFDDTYSYMATFLHECGHATGHEARLDRDLTGDFGSESYAREELRAEIASAFTAQSIGLQLTDEQLQYQTQRHAGYVQHWASILKNAPDELFRAIKDAESISDYLLEQGDFDNSREISSGKLGSAEYSVSPLPDGSGMELLITGEGDVPDFASEASRPYQAQAAAIRKAVIEDGITCVGDRVLSGLPSLERVSWPRSAQGIGQQQLEDCQSLKEIEFTGAHHSWMNHQHVRSPWDFPELSEKYFHFSANQREEIAAGFREGLTAEQISVYARREFDPGQMSSLRYCLASDLPPEQLAVIANPAFGAVQMDLIRSSFLCGMSEEQVSSIARPELTPNQMLDRYWEIRNDPSFTPCLPSEPKEPPMVQVPERLSLEEYLGKRGLASPIDDYMLDKHRLPHGETRRQQMQRQHEAELSSEAYHARREQAISEYKELVSKGAIVPTSVTEQKLIAARGQPEKETVQAARRSLEKRGINWITGDPLTMPSQDVIDAVHSWESRNLALMPEDLTTTAASENGQIAVRPGQCSLLLQRYHNHCLPPEWDAAERDFWGLDDFLKNGGAIAELADLYERDLDLEP